MEINSESTGRVGSPEYLTDTLGGTGAQVAQTSGRIKVVLPKLVNNSPRFTNDTVQNRTHDGDVTTTSSQIKLPEIHVPRREKTKLAFHKSITDLLEPETGLQNKVMVFLTLLIL